MTVTIALMPAEHRCSKRSDDVYQLGNMAALPEESRPSATNTGSQHAASSAVFRGPLPTCYPSKASCESSTDNCTGHGLCLLRSSTKDADKVNECYGCMCTIPEVRTNADGSKKTTYFGGAACHKKDVVMPFWLILGTTLILVFVISWGLGLLYSMGNEELPSVIGAGVSGPRAK